jgi:septal ring factor EnvC (AmiA/AmiB activator)
MSNEAVDKGNKIIGISQRTLSLLVMFITIMYFAYDAFVKPMLILRDNVVIEIPRITQQLKEVSEKQNQIVVQMRDLVKAIETNNSNIFDVRKESYTSIVNLNKRINELEKRLNEAQRDLNGLTKNYSEVYKK